MKKDLGHYNLMSETGEELEKEKRTPWQDYPRPQMKREKYQILNGEWILNKSKVRVPFPPQSSLSSYMQEVSDELLYEKTLYVPDDFTEGRILLHFVAWSHIGNTF